jgi:hypothetical protein
MFAQVKHFRQRSKTAGLPRSTPRTLNASGEQVRYRLVMRWQPDSPVCAECGFDWEIACQAAIELVAQAPDGAAAAMTAIEDPMRRTGDRWSASMYVWHLVDVLRIGTERLLTLVHDPGRGITCWDENALAEARRYQLLSPAVGLIVVRSAAQAWATTAAVAPADLQVRHPQFGLLGAVEIIRRNAHEVHHHVMDINRADAPR